MRWTLTFYLLFQSRVGTWASIYFCRDSEGRVCVKRQINETKKKPLAGHSQLQGRKFFGRAGSSYELFCQAMLQFPHPQGKFILVLFQSSRRWAVEKGNKQLGEIIPPVYVDFYQTGLATSCRGVWEKLRWEKERQTQTEARSWLFRYLVVGDRGRVPRK